MIVCVDSNVLISFLLSGDPNRPVNRIIEAAANKQFDMVVSETTLLEIRSSVAQKPGLQARISQEHIDQFLGDLADFTRIAAAITEPIPAICRDSRDDYLIATAVVEIAEIIVSGDKDLLVLDPLGEIRILSPATFMAFVDALPR